MTDRILTTLRSVVPRREGDTALLDVLVRRNPLLGHGPRTHATGIVVATDAAPAPVRRHARRRPLDVDAPKVHLGHAGRAA